MSLAGAVFARRFRAWQGRREHELLSLREGEDQCRKIAGVVTPGVLPFPGLLVLIATRGDRDGTVLLGAVVGLGGVESDGHTDSSGKRTDLFLGQ